MAEQQTRFDAAGFPKITKQALEYYQKGASDEEKKIVATAIRKAAKTIKKSLRGGEGEKQPKQKKGRLGLPTPEQLAAGLYKVLAQNEGAKVSGDPQNGEHTQIRGQFDLTEVARKLLSFSV